MKKLVALLIIAIVAMPAMAATTVSCAQVGTTKTFTVSYSYDGVGSAPRAFALDITTSTGTIAGVTAAKVGVSTSASKGFGIFPGTIVIDTAAGTVSNNGSPIAPDADLPAGTLDGIGTSGVTVELGSLYADSTGKPATSGVLVTVAVSTTPATITIAGNTARGGVVLEDATTVAASTSCALAGGVVDCFANSLTTYARWTLSGKPSCWCPPTSVSGAPVGGTGYQCLGDADQLKAPITNIRVGSGDLTKLSLSWNKVLGAVGYNTCADIDHLAAPITNIGVGSGDLTRVSQNWNALDAALNTKLGVGGTGGYCGTPTVPPAYK